MRYDPKFVRSSLKNLNLLKFRNPQVAYLIWNHKELDYLLFRLGRLKFYSALPSICVPRNYSNWAWQLLRTVLNRIPRPSLRALDCCKLKMRQQKFVPVNVNVPGKWQGLRTWGPGPRVTIELSNPERSPVFVVLCSRFNCLLTVRAPVSFAWNAARHVSE